MPITTFLDHRPFTALRGGAFLFLSDTGHAVTPTPTSDTGGGGHIAWVQGTANIPCRIDIAGGNEQLLAERISDRTTHFVFIPEWIDVDSGDRFAIDGRGTYVITSAGQR